jgi:2-alkyl-3-oxoalkanoate reductase
MKVLVTGATGFLGTRLCLLILKNGLELVALGRDPSKCRDLTTLGATVVRGDITDSETLTLSCKAIDTVFHLAALSAPWGPWADFYSVNVRGTENVIQACKRNGVRRLVHVSSPSVIFSGADLLEAQDDAPYASRFLSHYCATKKLAEDLINNIDCDLQTVIIRPKALFGPGDMALFPRLMAAAQRRRLFQIGNGGNLIDITYVDNAAHALFLAMTHLTSSGNTYTVTNDEHVNIWELVKNILSKLDLEVRGKIPFSIAYHAAHMMEVLSRLRCGPEPQFTRFTVCLLARTQTFDISRAKRDLNYVPTVSIADGISKTLDSLRTHYV